MNNIETKRLTLERINMQHCTQEYLNWLNDPEVYKYLETRGNQTMGDLKEFVSNIINSNTLMWAILVKETGKHIGNIKLDPYNKKHRYAEFGILMGNKEQWGKGYAKEATNAIINTFFSPPFSLRKINLGLVSENVSALNLYKNLGFEVEGIYKKHVIYDRHVFDIIRMAIFNPT